MTANQKSISVKENQVKDLAEAIKRAKTVMIVNIKNLPSKQFHEIKKVIREHASVKVAKKNIMIRALKEVGKDSILGLEEYIEADCVFVISDLEGYELAGILAKKKTPVYARVGQIAESDIEIPDGPTPLVPGPAISELGALGIQVAVEDGKIAIKAPKIVTNKGGEITEGVASLLQKLDIMPFSVGLNIKVAYDVEEEKIYTELKIDSEGYTEELMVAAGKALGFAQKIFYYCKDTIGYFLAKANAEGEKIESFVKEDVEERKKEEETGTDNSIEGNVAGDGEAKADKPVEEEKDEEKIKGESTKKEKKDDEISGNFSEEDGKEKIEEEIEEVVEEKKEKLKNEEENPNEEKVEEEKKESKNHNLNKPEENK